MSSHLRSAGVQAVDDPKCNVPASAVPIAIFLSIDLIFHVVSPGCWMQVTSHPPSILQTSSFGVSYIRESLRQRPVPSLRVRGSSVQPLQSILSNPAGLIKKISRGTLGCDALAPTMAGPPATPLLSVATRASAARKKSQPTYSATESPRSNPAGGCGCAGRCGG